MATLKVKIQEDIILDNQDYGSKRVLEITGINEVYKRMVVCPGGADATIATFQTATNTSDNALDLENVKYIRVTNLESSNPCNLSLQVAGAEGGTANMSTSILLEAGKSFMMGTVHDGIGLSDANATIITSLNDLESILIDGSDENITVEVFVASV